MAIKPFNSVGGYSVGPNLTPFLDANNNANVNNLEINGNVDLSGNIDLAGNIVANNITANSQLSGNTLSISNTGNITGTLFVGGNVTANANLVVTTNANIGGTSNVVGAATFGSTVDITGVLTTTTHANIGGDLTVTGQTTLGALTTITSGDLVVNDGLTTHGNVIMDADTGGYITIGDNTNGTNVSISGANVTLGQLSNLHILGGSNLQYLQTDGSGNLVWATVDTDTLANGNTIVSIDVAAGPVLFQVNGNANVMVVNETSVDFEGNINTLGTVTADTFYANTLANVAALDVRTTATIAQWANITGNIIGGTDFALTGIANIGGALNVTGATDLASTLQVDGETTIGTVGTPANLLVYGDANVRTDLIVGGKANIASTANVVGNIDAGSNLNVSGNANITTDLNVTGNAFVTGFANVTGVLTVTGNIDGNVNLNLIGDANIRDLGARGNANVAGTANIVGATDLGSTLGVVGIATFGANIDGNVDLNLVGNANILDLSARGKANITGTANIGGAVELGSTLDVTGIATFDANVTVGTGTTLFFDTANGATLNATTAVNTVDLAVTGLTNLNAIGNITITGGANGQILSTDGAGNLSWTSTANINSIVNGTSNVSIPTADGNVYVGVNGQANIITVQSNGTFATTTLTNDVLITGNLTVSGDVTNIDTTTLNVEDPVITEGRGANNAPLTLNDGKDRGLYSWYYDGAEKGGFVGYKNAGAFAGSYVIAKDATLTDNVVGVTTYANVVVAGIVSGAAGNVSGNPVSAIDMGTGSAISFRVNSEAAVLNVTADDITANANVAVSGNVGVTGGNITVTGGTSGAYGSQINLAAAATTGPGVLTTIGSGVVTTASSTPTPIVTLGDAEGRTVEFFVSSRDTITNNFEGAKYLVVSDGTGNVDWTSYGTVRMGNAAQQVAVSFTSDGSTLVARVAVLDNTSITTFSTQYQIVG